MFKKPVSMDYIIGELCQAGVVADPMNAIRPGAPETLSAEAHVVKKMLSIGSQFGGEGGGGVIIPAVHPGRDAATAIAMVLEALARDRRRRPISRLNADTPRYHIAKDRVTLEKAKIPRILRRLQRLWPEPVEIDSTDGVKFIGDRWWAHVRASGTEPIVRIYCEARTRRQAEALSAQARRLLRQAARG